MRIRQRITKSLLLLTAATCLTVGCNRDDTRSVSTRYLAEVQIPIEGMVCASCVARTKRALKSVRGVEEVEVSLEKHQARVRYDSTQTNPDQLAATIRELGYKPGTSTEITK
jgi:copper chaperone CopZ